MRLIFMGTPPFARVILEALLGSPHEVVGVYTQPPRPAGRGHRLQKSPVQDRAEQAGLPVFTPRSLRPPEEAKTLSDLKPDALVVAAYGLIIPESVLQIPPYGGLNVHTSLLPRWRGAAPIQRAILAGDARTGVTLMQMDKGLDTGDILLQEAIPLSAQTTTPELEDTLAALGARLCLETVRGLEAEILPARPQPTEGVTYAEKLSKTEGLLNWAQPAIVLDRQIRALNPWPGTYFLQGGQAYRVQKAEVVSQTDAPTHSPGTILDAHLTVQCGEDALRLSVLQKPGRSPMAARDFLNGTPLPVGTQLGEQIS